MEFICRRDVTNVAIEGGEFSLFFRSVHFRNENSFYCVLQQNDLSVSTLEEWISLLVSSVCRNISFTCKSPSLLSSETLTNIFCT